MLGQERALQYRLAAVLRELDTRAHLDGKPLRLPRWLHQHFGLTFGAAREKVRTARALGKLPLIDAAFRDGALSYSKVRALTRAATPENEAELLKRAKRTDAEGVERLVRCVKQQACIGDVQEMIRSRSLSTRWDDSGALIVQGRLTPEQGELFLKALARATERLAGSESHRPTDQTDSRATDDPDTYWARRADALVQVMADSLNGGASSTPGDRHQVHVHVSAETLANASTVPAETLAPVKTVPAETSAGARDVPAETPADLKTIPAETSAHAKNVLAETLSGPKRVPAETLHPETIRRLACDGGLVTLITNPTGDPLSVGRKTRAIPPATRRALVSRDRRCQYPGCSQEHYVEGHHIVHWANGGETRLDNLVLLCGRHHRAVHEFGYRIERQEDGTFAVTKSTGQKTVCTSRARKVPVETE